MNLGIFLPVGDSFKNMAKSGQDVRFKRFYLSAFSKEFEKVIIFSYENEQVLGLPQNVKVVPNKYNLHRFLYAIFLPFLNIGKIQQCDVLRVYHLFGTPPAIISKIFFLKPYVFNYAYDYKKFAQIEKNYLQLYLIKSLEPIAIFFSKKIFAANKIILKKLSKEKAVYLPNGVDTDFFKLAKNKQSFSMNKKRNKQSFSANKIPVILSVGRLEKQKNFEALVDAMKGLDAKLVIVGCGSLKKKLKNQAKINQVDLKIIDKVPHTQMPKIYNSADIFVLPSYIEGSPKALLEAMSCGLPVIGTDTEEINEVLNGTNGRKCGTSRESISAAVNYLIKNPDFRIKVGKEARKFIVNNFHLEALLKKEIKIIEEAF